MERNTSQLQRLSQARAVAVHGIFQGAGGAQRAAQPQRRTEKVGRGGCERRQPRARALLARQAARDPRERAHADHRASGPRNFETRRSGILARALGVVQKVGSSFFWTCFFGEEEEEEAPPSFFKILRWKRPTRSRLGAFARLRFGLCDSDSLPSSFSLSVLRERERERE